MKNWFPLTDYDFYAFLTAGMILVAAADFSFGGSQLIERASWTIPGAVFWIVVAYLIGQVTAGWSASVLEFGIGRRFFSRASRSDPRFIATPSPRADAPPARGRDYLG